MNSKVGYMLLPIFWVCIVPIAVIVFVLYIWANRTVKKTSCSHCMGKLKVYGWQSINKITGKKRNTTLYFVGSVAAVIGGPLFVLAAFLSTGINPASIVQQSGTTIVYDEAANSLQNLIMGVIGLALAIIGGLGIYNLIKTFDLLLFTKCLNCNEKSEIRVSELKKLGSSPKNKPNV